MQFMITILLFILEILFYSLFIKFSKKEGKIWKYLLLFTIVSLIVGFINSKNLLAYFVFVLSTYLGLKYIVKVKVSLYDMLVILIMLLLKVIIELPLFIIFYNLIHCGHVVASFIFQIVKLMFVFICRKKLNNWYLKFKSLWDKNEFNIRYCFTIFMYFYILLTITLLIKMIWR